MVDKVQTTGSRRQVWNRSAKKTSGGLQRGDLFQDKYGNIKSRKASNKAKRNKNLKKAGWTVKKGQFGAVKIADVKKKKKKGSPKKSKKRSSKKGGNHCGSHPRIESKKGGVHHNNHPSRASKKGGNHCGSHPRRAPKKGGVHHNNHPSRKR